VEKRWQQKGRAAHQLPITTEATRLLRDADDGTRTTLVTRLDDYRGNNRSSLWPRHSPSAPRQDQATQRRAWGDEAVEVTNLRVPPGGPGYLAWHL